MVCGKDNSVNLPCLTCLPIWSSAYVTTYVYTVRNRRTSLLRSSFDSVPSIEVTNVFIYYFASVNREFIGMLSVTNMVDGHYVNFHRTLLCCSSHAVTIQGTAWGVS